MKYFVALILFALTQFVWAQPCSEGKNPCSSTEVIAPLMVSIPPTAASQAEVAASAARADAKMQLDKAANREIHRSMRYVALISAIGTLLMVSFFVYEYFKNRRDDRLE